MDGAAPVICLHGFGLSGAVTYLLRRRLEDPHGFQTLSFSYASVTASLDENAEALAQFIREQDLTAAHFVGHSLGGVVALRMLTLHPNAVPGRVVCLGSPLCGSSVAKSLKRFSWAQSFVAPSLSSAMIDETANDWATDVCAKRDVGVIAGTSGFGVGAVVTTFDGNNDGTVAVSETRIDGARDHLCLPVSHTSMLMSHEVADQTAAFLKTGHFAR